MKAKKILACILAGTLMVTGAMPVFAGETPSTSDEKVPIYAYEKLDVIVPTSFTVALNPDGLDVTIDKTSSPAVTSTAQVLSYNYGIINNSTTGKKIIVDIKVEDPTGTIIFGDDTALASATADDHMLCLEVKTTNDTAAKLTADNGLTHTTTSADLANLKVDTSVWSTGDPTYIGNSGSIGFFLAKGAYTQSTTDPVVLGTSEDNDVLKNYTLTGMGGVTAFTFTGSMNTKASWAGITAQPKITATYTFKTAELTDVTKVADTDSQIELGTAPTFTATATGITYTKGTGDRALGSIVSIELLDKNGWFDAYNAHQTAWKAATDDDNGTVTFDTTHATYYPDTTNGYPAKVTYTTADGGTVTVEITGVYKANTP